MALSSNCHMTIMGRSNNGATARSVTPMTIQIQGASAIPNSPNHIFLPDVVLDMPATQGMAVAQYMVVGLFMVAVMVMVVMDHAVAQLFLLNMLVIWRLVCPKLLFCKQLSLVVNK